MAALTAAASISLSSRWANIPMLRDVRASVSAAVSLMRLENMLTAHAVLALACTASEATLLSIWLRTAAAAQAKLSMDGTVRTIP